MRKLFSASSKILNSRTEYSQQSKTDMAVYTYLVLVLALHAFSEVDATSYARLESPDGFFKLQWTYNNGKLIFKMTCKTTGWCAVGFTTTADGRNMVNYDIAVGGFASGAGYVDVSQSKLCCCQSESARGYDIMAL